MLSWHIVTLAFGALSLLTVRTAAEEFDLLPRQDTGAAPPSSQASSPLAASSSVAPGPSTSASGPESTIASSTALSTALPPPSTSTTLSTSATLPQPSGTISSSLRPSATNGTSSRKHPEPPLPLQPQLTPTLGVAGVIMMISGVVYTIIGVKNKMLHISFSVTYLVALGIVVLLDYVANPPISNALQGAYFAAAFFPACLLGGLALVFKDIVEGMGCLLGGFCFGMWVMTLKAGGVADSTGARAGVICGLAGGGYALSFSHHTREPGLIACLSFAGATVVVLGVDMFSRAGLGEFWLYIWNLNPDIFPLGTKTYPMTRGIKVEIAAIVIIAVTGAMSQMRLWKIIKKQRAKRAEQRKKDEENRAIVDEERNREFMETHKKEHKEWEREYGNKAVGSVSEASQPDSTAHDSAYRSDDPSYPKSSASIKDTSQPPYLELTDFGSLSRRSSKTTISPRRHSKDKGLVIASEETLPRTESHRPKQSNPDALKSLEKISERPSRNPSIKEYAVKSGSEDGQSEQSNVDQWPLGPAVKPLPFKVPAEGEDAERNDDNDDARSLATAGDTVMLDEIILAPGKDKGHMAGRTLKRTSESNGLNSGDEGFDVPHVDDARSSVAATLDGVSSHDGSLPALSRSGTPLPDVEDHAGGTADGQKTYTLHKNQSAGDLIEKAFKEADEETAQEVDANRRHSVQILGAAPESTLGSLANLPNSETSESEKQAPAIIATRARSTSEGSQTKRDSKPAALTKDALPEGQSSTVHLYRTNEWAKHQALADTPEVEDVAPPSEEGVTVDYGKEISAPVNVKSLQQTAFNQPKSASSRKMSSNNPYLKQQKRRSASSPQQSSSNLGRTKSGPAVPVYSSAKQVASPMRSSSNPNASNSSLLNTRNSSTNVLSQPVPELPGEKSNSSSKQQKPATRTSKTPPPLKDTNNLIRLRESKMQNRMSTMSFANLPETSTSTVNTTGAAAQDDLGDGRNNSTTTFQGNVIQEEEEDDVPLAQRQAQLKRSSAQQPSQHYQLGRSSTSPYHNSMANNTMTADNAGVGGLPYDAHQPTRGATVSAATRESRLASWRASMNNLPNPSEPALAAPNIKLEAKRQHMIESQRKQDEEKFKKEMNLRMRENVMDEKMRSGEATDLHRKKLQQMQRQASGKAAAGPSKQ